MKTHKKHRGNRKDASKKKRFCLTKMNYGTTKGWWLRIYRRKRCVVSEFFASGIYGGFRKAELAARERRDELLNILPPATFGHPCNMPHTKVRSNNRSGINGVHFAVVKKRFYSKGKGKWIEYETPTFFATWREDGRQRERSFSVPKHGFHRAKQLAEIVRKQEARRVRCKGDRETRIRMA